METAMISNLFPGSTKKGTKLEQAGFYFAQ